VKAIHFIGSEVPKRARRGLFIVAFFVAAACSAQLSPRYVAQPSNQSTLTQDKPLKAFLQRYLSEAPPVGADKTTRYSAVSVDLRDDGEEEVLVYVQGRDWCGSGGCVTLILAPKEVSYRVVMRATITPPDSGFVE
jgi:hypothetical protein